VDISISIPTTFVLLRHALGWLIGALRYRRALLLENIRRNRNNAADRLGFLGRRVVHGTKPRAWLQEVRQRAGETIDFGGLIGV